MNWTDYKQFDKEQLDNLNKRIEVLCLVEYYPPLNNSYTSHIVLTYCPERKQLVYARHNYSVYEGYVYEDEFCKILKYIIL